MDFYLFDYRIILGMQQLFFFLSGCVIACLALYIFAPGIEKLQRAKRISRIKQIHNLTNSVCSLQDELFFYRNKYFNMLETFKKFDKERKDVEQTIITLSQEKDKLLDDKKLLETERNHYYLQTDKLKAEIHRLISPAYVRSNKSISEEGKIE